MRILFQVLKKKEHRLTSIVQVQQVQLLSPDPTLNNALSKTVTSVDKTITASPQTIVSVVKQANTRLTLGGTHGYEGIQRNY